MRAGAPAAPTPPGRPRPSPGRPVGPGEAMTTRRRTRLALWPPLVAAAALLAAGVGWRAADPGGRYRAARVERLIDDLGRPRNRVTIANHVIPGGEILSESRPMRELIE